MRDQPGEQTVAPDSSLEEVVDWPQWPFQRIQGTLEPLAAAEDAHPGAVAAATAASGDTSNTDCHHLHHGQDASDSNPDLNLLPSSSHTGASNPQRSGYLGSSTAATAAHSHSHSTNTVHRHHEPTALPTRALVAGQGEPLDLAQAQAQPQRQRQPHLHNQLGDGQLTPLLWPPAAHLFEPDLVSIDAALLPASQDFSHHPGPSRHADYLIDGPSLTQPSSGTACVTNSVEAGQSTAADPCSTRGRVQGRTDKGKEPARCNMHTDSSILGASHHDGEADPTLTATPAAEAARGTAPAEAMTSRKRSKPSERGGIEEAVKRARGRPRLEDPDGDPAERRRTQIRIAQRNYRGRKETTIKSLEGKVKTLEEQNDSMNKTVSKFYNTMLSSGLLDAAPEIAHRLKSLSQSMVTVTEVDARSTSPDPDGPDQEAAAPKTAATEGIAVGAPGPFTVDGHASKDISAPPLVPSIQPACGIGLPGPSAADNIAGKPQTPLDGSANSVPPTLPYEIVAQPTLDNASFPQETFATPPSDFNPMLFGSSPSAFTGSPFSGISSPMSYSASEITFGRRLERRTAERGLILATMQNPPAERFAAVFGFCLLFEPRDAIIRRLVTMVDRSSLETIHYWNAPFSHLGRAGLRFPDQKASLYAAADQPPAFPQAGDVPAGNRGLSHQLGRPENSAGFGMGPFNATIESVRDERLDDRMRMDFPNFEGDFLDSDEVEIYLRQRGVWIPGRADWVEVDIDVHAFEDARIDLADHQAIHAAQTVEGGSSFGGALPANVSSSSGANGMWAGYEPQALGGIVNPDLPAGSYSATCGQDVTVGPSGLSMSPATFFGGQYSMPSASAAASNPWATVGAMSTRLRVRINVQKLVDEMVNSSVCLGRSPGVRPKHVNRALRLAAGLHVEEQ